MNRWVLACLLAVLTVGCAGPRALDPAESPRARELAAHRAAIVTFAEALAAEGTGAPEALAQIVQHAADRAVAHVGLDAPHRARVRLFLDHLVDLSLGAARPGVQHALMTTTPVYAGPPLAEGMFEPESFAPAFRPGEGRFRHFALAAAATYVFPPLWVEVAARWIGGDFFPAPGSDSAADVAANAAGRDFGLWLRTVEPAVFADGERIERWIRERFAEAVR